MTEALDRYAGVVVTLLLAALTALAGAVGAAARWTFGLERRIRDLEEYNRDRESSIAEVKGLLGDMRKDQGEIYGLVRALSANVGKLTGEINRLPCTRNGCE